MMQFQPNRSLMILQLIGALILAAIPAALAAIPLYLFLGNRLPFVVPIVVGVFLAILFLRVLFILLHYPTIRYEIDGQNVTNSEGLVWRVKRSTPLDKVTNVDVRQGPLDRMLGIGEIWLFTPSTGALTPEAKLIGIDRPHDLRARILALAEDAKATDTQPAAAANLERRDTEALLVQTLETLKRIEKLLGGPPARSGG
jgi:membrane protein YdbS with pleckstrin-like domain